MMLIGARNLNWINFVGEAVRKIVDQPVEQAASKNSSVISAKDLHRLREFGVLMAAVLTGISALLLWRQRPAALYTLIVAALFLIPAFTAPKILAPIEKLWLGFGHKMSIVMTTILLVITYFLLMTPIGIFLRLLGKDLLDVKLDKRKESYWKEIEKDGPSTRPYLPY